MTPPLVPVADIEDCLEAHLADHAPSGTVLYLTIIGLVLAAFASMPIIDVPITIQADGILRPSIERQEARAAESGVVASVRTVNGAQVEAGDTLLTLNVSSLATRLTLLDSMALAQAADIADLEALLATADDALSRIDLRTAHRRQQAREYLVVDDDLAARSAAAHREGDRIRALYGSGFVTPQQLDEHEEAQRAAAGAIEEHRERTRAEWSHDLATHTDEARRLDAERLSLREAISRYAVLAPVQGTVELDMSLSPGSVLERGERVATISPNTNLVAETRLTPRDIGLVGVGTPVRLMVDAFNYRDWGVVDGVVTEIADDASLERDAPRFRVRCYIGRTDLQRRGGQRATLKKGMTFRARFLVADRSLLQLLFDDVDDWLNPARAPASGA